MKRHVQAALRSALIFPGLGQLFLGKRMRAAAYAVPTLVAAGFFIADVLRPILVLQEEFKLKALDGQSIDPIEVLERVHAMGIGASSGIHLAVFVIVGCWAASIIDAWLSGRQDA